MKRSALALLLTVLAASMPLGGYSQVRTAPTVALPSGSNADLRPAYATPQDIAEGRRVAEASCTGCHGVNGISTSTGVPHLAGQRPGYLYVELLTYQAGGRGDSAMSKAVKFLKDDALVKVSAYYAGLEPAQPTAAGVAKPAPAKPDPVGAGKAAAAGCGGCHGETGITKTPGMPSLAGLDPKYFVASVGAYKSGKRKHDMMKTLVSALSDADLNNIALFYAIQKPAKAQTPSPGNQAAGKAASATCAGCHGEGGVSANPATPSLAGQDAQYFADAMRAYKDGSRADPMMKAPAASVDDNAVKNLAAYYANQQPRPPAVKKPLTTAELAQRCDRCHGVNGNSTDPRSPALAAQRADYLEKAMRAYQKGGRKSTAMTAMLDGLSGAEIERLAAHYSSQRARSVIYVLLPPK
ncbi:MAG: c-type cytochrome [Betaproteobacteria bacterium]|nr:c-type cytochrome [Betaproteobacteria bacterium]